MKRKFRITALLAAALLLTGCGGGGYGLAPQESGTAEEERQLTEAEIAQMKRSVETISSRISENEEFAAATPEERKALTEKMLTEMERTGQIKRDSAQFDEESNCYVFELNPGGEIIVDLKDEPEEDDLLEGLGSVRSAWYEGEEITNYRGDTEVRRPDWGEITSPYREPDKTALILDNLHYSGQSGNLQVSAAEWSECHLQTTCLRDPELDAFRYGWENYDMVFVRCHGDKIGNNLYIDLECTGSFDAQDYSDMFAGRVSFVFSVTQLYCIKPAFFDYYYGNTPLNGNFIWLGCCHGYQNTSFAASLLECGADCVVGANESVNTYYGTHMMDAFVFYLLCGETAAKAFNHAKELCGETDAGGTKFLLAGIGDPALFTLTDEAAIAAGIAEYFEVSAKPETETTAPPAETTAPPATTKAPEKQTEPAPTPEPQPEQPSAKPVLRARCIEETLVSGGNPHGESATLDHQYVYVGDVYDVAYFESDRTYSENYISILLSDAPAYMGPQGNFMLLPDEAYVASLSDAELKSLAAALYFQYSDIFRRYAWGQWPMGVTGTGDIRNTGDGMYYERLTPAITWNDLMNDLRQYFTADYVVTGYSGNEDLSLYMKEIDGQLWRINGIGQIAEPTTVRTSGIRSRTADEIVFDMSVTREDPTGSKSTTTETLIIHLENGMWKCKQVPFEWNMS